MGVCEVSSMFWGWHRSPWRMQIFQILDVSHFWCWISYICSRSVARLIASTESTLRLPLSTGANSLPKRRNILGLTKKRQILTFSYFIYVTCFWFCTDSCKKSNFSSNLFLFLWHLLSKSCYIRGQHALPTVNQSECIWSGFFCLGLLNTHYGLSS